MLRLWPALFQISTYFLWLFFCDLRVSADLPIHGLTSDVVGLWKILEIPELQSMPQSCGGSIPNDNFDNLKIHNYKSYLEGAYGRLKERVIELSDERTEKRGEVPPRNNWRYLCVKDGTNYTIIGNWTMIYDEGFEITIGNKKYFGYLKYERVPGRDCPRVMEEAQEEEDGSTPCYRTNPSEIHVGWTSEKILKDGKVSHLWGCFYAEKVQKITQSSYVLDQSLKFNNLNPNSSNMTIHSTLWERKEYPQFADLSPFRFMQLRKGVSFKSIHHSLGEELPENAQKPRFLQRESRRSIYACQNEPKHGYSQFLSLPLKWSWGDAFGGDDIKDIQLFSQGQCGSCYAMSGAYILGKRFEIMARKLFPKFNWDKVEFELSVQNIVSCSLFGQGCLGGFPYLVGKHLMEFGAPPEAKLPYKMTNQDQLPKCDAMYNYPECLRWFASGYGYVGGCYECTTEFEMMKEIYHHGPISAAIDASGDMFTYSDGIFDHQPAGHGKICDMQHSNLNGWEYTNHAIAIVGWGEEQDPHGGEPKKYWIARNTWGQSWGVRGFFKIRRGVNLGGIESQAVFIDPDFSRGIGRDLLSSISPNLEDL